MNVIDVIRKLHPSDLLLPVGAALVTAGIEALGQREQRQRDRLAALQASVSDHLDALLASGVEIPPALAVDELHPFDAPGLADPVSDSSSNSYPAGSDISSGRGRRWRLAAGLLLVASGITLHATRRRWVPMLASLGAGDELADAAAAEYAATLNHEHSDRWTGGDRKDEDTASPWDHAVPVADEPSEGLPPAPAPVLINGEPPADDDRVSPGGIPATGYLSAVADLRPTGGWPAAVDEDAPAPPDEPFTEIVTEQVDEPSAPGDECGWTGCTWAPKPSTRGAARVTALAVHRSRCPHRPPSMTVPGA